MCPGGPRERSGGVAPETDWFMGPYGADAAVPQGSAYVTGAPSLSGSIYNYQITMRLFLRDGYVTEALSYTRYPGSSLDTP
jgi:hypothetical protein